MTSFSDKRIKKVFKHLKSLDVFDIENAEYRFGDTQIRFAIANNGCNTPVIVAFISGRKDGIRETRAFDFKGNELNKRELNLFVNLDVEVGDDVTVRIDEKGLNVSEEDMAAIVNECDDVEVHQIQEYEHHRTGLGDLEIKEFYGRINTKDGTIRKRIAATANGVFAPTIIRGFYEQGPYRTIRAGTKIYEIDDESGAVKMTKNINFIRRERTDLIILDLNDDGIKTIAAETGVSFDILGTGKAVQTGWTGGGDDAFLVLDRDSSGAIESGKELFGNQNGAINGYDELAKFDDNNDGVIDSQDAIFEKLQLWNDANVNGIIEEGELCGLSEKGIASISTGFITSDFVDESGNEYRQISTFRKTDGSAGLSADVWFNYRDSTTNSKNER